MSKCYWGNGIAVGLVAGICLAALFFIVWYGVECSPNHPCDYGQYGDGQEKSIWYDTIAQWLAATTGVAVAGFTFWTIILVRKALTADDAALDEARKQTSFAEKAVAEARRQADLAEEAYRKSERPYLFFRYVDTLGLSQIQGSAPHIEYKLANYGKTPAIFDSIYIELVPVSKLKYENRIPTFAPETSPREWYEVILAGRDANNGDRVYLTGIPDIATQKWNPANETIALHAHIFYRDPSSATRYEHHFALLSYNGKPFRLDFSHHQSTDEG